MRVWRVVHPELDPAIPEIRLSAAESHHVARVLRLRVGDRVGVFDGRGHEWQACLTVVGRDAVEARLEQPCLEPVEPDLAVDLFQALCRPDRFEWALQKGTEIGVRRFVPVIAQRSEPVRIGAARLARWRRVVIEACKQSGRRWIPAIDEPCAIDEARPDGSGWVLDAGDAPAIAHALGGPPRSVAILVGPESGLGEDELATLERLGWSRVSLGPRVLRTETAGPVAAALVLHAWADLGR